MKVQRWGRILTHFFKSTLTVFVYNFDMFIEFEIVWQAIESNISCNMILHFIQQMNVIPTPNTQNNNFHVCSSLTVFLILHLDLVGFCLYCYWNVLYFVNWKWSMPVHLAYQMSNANKSFSTQHLFHYSQIRNPKRKVILNECVFYNSSKQSFKTLTMKMLWCEQWTLATMCNKDIIIATVDKQIEQKMKTGQKNQLN